MRIVFIIISALFLQWSLAQDIDKLELLDIYNLEFVSDPQISPDGQRIIYVRNFKDIMSDKNFSNLWIINFDGTGHRPITTGNQSDFSPRWSNDGTKLAYKSNKDGAAQVYVKWLDNGAESKITNTQHSANQFSWSPDDKHLAFSMFVPSKPSTFIRMPDKPEGAEWNDPPIYIDDLKYRADGSGYLKDGYSQLFLLSTNGGTPRQLTKSNNHHGAPAWTPDGKALIFSANLAADAEYSPRNTEIHTLNIASGAIQTLTHRFGPDQNPVVSPDAKKIAYLGLDDQFLGYQLTQLYTMDINGDDKKLHSLDFDRSIGNIHWKSDGSGLYFQYDDRGDTKIAFMDLEGKVSDLADRVGGLSIGRPYNGGTFTIAKNGNYAYTLGGIEHPADLAVGNGTDQRRLTYLNDDLFSYKKLGEVEEIWYESSYDQLPIQGWIVKPPDFDPNKKYPLLLEIHGGPFSSYGFIFSAEAQLYASAGYVVLYTNPRGSTSYGKDFGNLIHHNYPSEDYDDLISGVDAVIEKGYIDEGNLFVTGGSGGGVLSSWIVGKTDRFKAAVVAKPVINWYSFALYADNPAFFAKYWFGEYPWENPEAYMKRSPISLVGNVTTPTMLLTGEEDYRTPIAESEQYYTALKLRKVPSALVRIPGASHGIAAKPSNLIAKVSAVLSWFDKYRLQKP